MKEREVASEISEEEREIKKRRGKAGGRERIE